MVSYSTVVVACLVLADVMRTTDAFLFPDLRQRSGMSGPAYKVAVIEEEPYLYSNGSGYVTDLLQQLSKTYSTLHGGKEIQLDIVPVRTFQQLMSKAKSTRFQIAFGLVVPSLSLSSSWPWRSLRSTLPALYTSAKVVSKSSVGLSSDEDRAQGQVIVVKDSPLEHLLVRENTYPGTVRTAENVEAAVDLLHSAEGAAVFFTDAATADRIAQKDSHELQSFCPKEIPGTRPLNYAFFGKDSTLLGYLSEAILNLSSNDELFRIYRRHFGEVAQCPM